MQFLRKIYHQIPEPVRRKRHELKAFLGKSYWLFRNGIHDTYRVARHSSSLKAQGSQGNQKAKLTFFYHKIEKAMALPKPRVGFGRQWIEGEFTPLLREYYATYGYDDVVGSCYANLQAYLAFNRSVSAEHPEVSKTIELTLRQIKTPPSIVVGGVRMVSAAGIKIASGIDFERFVNSRHSIRNFSAEPVSRDMIEKAVGIAQRTPSVCNRQPWHVYGFSDKSAFLELLKLQNGNEGFAENIQTLLVVAGDLSAMMSSSERNEIWVDGGLFSMSLVYSLHSLGLGTCCLNLCHNADQENNLRALVKMAEEHSPVMMIAVGHLPDTLLVAQSKRKPLGDVLTWC